MTLNPAMPLRFFSPPAALRQQVQAIWCLDTRLGKSNQSEEPAFMHPDGGTGFVLHLGRPLPPRVPGEQPPAWLGWEGVQSVSGRLALDSGWLSYGVRFHPGGARRFWQGMPMQQTSTDALEALYGGDLWQLRQRLGEAKDIQAGLHSLAGWLMRQMQVTATGGAMHRDASFAVTPNTMDAVLVAVAQAESVARAAAEMHLSRRALERRFADQVGVSPKQYARIQRIARARGLLKRGVPRQQAELAQRLGYFDEAHFIHDFRAMVGMTPGQYARRQSPFRLSVPVVAGS